MAKKTKPAAADDLDDNLDADAAAGPDSAAPAADEAPSAPAKPKRAKQQRLPGMEEPTFPDLDDAAEEYASVRDERMKLTKKEVDAHAKLIELMHSHKLSTYKFDGYIVELDVKEKAKVKRDKDDDDTDDDDDDE